MVATDLISQRTETKLPTFQLAHKALNSKVEYHPSTSVYNIESLGITDFDIVIFGGVYYHLRHPILALSKLRTVMKPGARIVIEGDILTHCDQPINYFFYKKQYSNDPSNWCVPSAACHRQWVESSYFSVEHSWPLTRRQSKRISSRG